MASGPKQIVLASLPANEKERFYDFLVTNNVDFVPRGEGYVATVRVVDANKSPGGGGGTGASGARTRTPLRSARSHSANSARATRQLVARGMQPVRPKSTPKQAERGYNGATVGSASHRANLISMDVQKPRVVGATDEDSGDEIEHRTTSLIDLKNNFARFATLLNVEPRIKPMPRLQLLRLLDEMYEARFTFQLAYERACESSETEPKPLSAFPMFVLDHIAKHYGLRKITMKTAWSLVASVDLLRSDHVSIELFAKFLNESFDHTTDLVFYLNARHAVEAVVSQKREALKSQRRNEFHGTRLNAKSCIAVVLTLTKDESYKELRRVILEKLDEAKWQLDGGGENGTLSLDADRLLSICTECYSTMRQDQGMAAEEAHEEDHKSVDHDTDDDAQPEQSGSKAAPIESTIKEMDPEVQMRVHRTADKLLQELDAAGRQATKNEVYDWTVRTAMRSQESTQARGPPEPKPSQFDVSITEMNQVVSRINKEKKPQLLKTRTQLVDSGASPIEMERDRLLSLEADEFEGQLESNVRQLLIATTEELARTVAAELKSADEAILRNALVKEFAPVADAMMEALVNDNFVRWLGEVKQDLPGTDKQRSHFENLHGDFRSGLAGIINANTVYEICKAVTSTSELQELVSARAKVIAADQAQNAMAVVETDHEEVGDMYGDKDEAIPTPAATASTAAEASTAATTNKTAATAPLSGDKDAATPTPAATASTAAAASTAATSSTAATTNKTAATATVSGDKDEATPTPAATASTAAAASTAATNKAAATATTTATSATVSSKTGNASPVEEAGAEHSDDEGNLF